MSNVALSLSRTLATSIRFSGRVREGEKLRPRRNKYIERHTHTPDTHLYTCKSLVHFRQKARWTKRKRKAKKRQRRERARELNHSPWQKCSWHLPYCVSLSSLFSDRFSLPLSIRAYSAVHIGIAKWFLSLLGLKSSAVDYCTISKSKSNSGTSCNGPG